MPVSTVRPGRAAAFWVRSALAVGLQGGLAAVTCLALLWLDKHWAAQFVLGRRDSDASGDGLSVPPTQLHHVPVWCIAGWVATYVVGGSWSKLWHKKAWFLYFLSVWLPLFAMLKRALLVYRWCFDPAGKQVPPSFLVGYTIIFIFVFALPDYLSHDEPAEQDPLMSVDWSEAAAVNARFRARALAGYILEDIFARSRGASGSANCTSEPLPKSRAPAGLAAIYTAYSGKMASDAAMSEGLGSDAANPTSHPSVNPSTSSTRDDPFAQSSGGKGASGSPVSTSVPVTKMRAPAGLAAVYTAAHSGQVLPNRASSEGLGSDAGLAPAYPPIDPSNNSSPPSIKGVKSIPMGLAPGRTPTLSDTPILPPAPSGPSTSPGTNRCWIPLPLEGRLLESHPSTGASPVTPATPFLPIAASPVDSRLGSFIASPARQPSMGFGIAAVRVPSTTDKKLLAAKAGQMGMTKTRNGGQASEAIPVNVSARTMPAAHRTLLRKSSSIKIAEIRTHLAELTNKVKEKSRKGRKSLSTASSSVADQSPNGSPNGNPNGSPNDLTLRRGSSWKAATKAIKSGFTHKSIGRAVGV